MAMSHEAKMKVLRDAINNRGHVEVGGGPGSPEDLYIREILASQSELQDYDVSIEETDLQENNTEVSQETLDPALFANYEVVVNPTFGSVAGARGAVARPHAPVQAPRYPLPPGNVIGPQYQAPALAQGPAVAPNPTLTPALAPGMNFAAVAPLQVPPIPGPNQLQAQIPAQYRVLPTVYVPLYDPNRMMHGLNGPNTASLLLPVAHPPTLRIQPRGKELFPWTPARQRMWLAAHPGSALPLDAHRATYNYLHIGTPGSANITLLGNLAVTAVEILTYFPHHTIWREVMHRLERADWTAASMVEVICYVRGIGCRDTIKRTTIQHQLATTRDKWARNRVIPATWSFGNIATDSGLDGNLLPHLDFPVINLADGVLFHPTGSSEGALTRAVLRCRRTNDFTVMLSTVAVYIALHGLDQNLAPRNPHVRAADRRALRDIGPIAKDYFQKSVGAHK